MPWSPSFVHPSVHPRCFHSSCCIFVQWILPWSSGPGVSLQVGHIQVDFYISLQVEHIQNSSHQFSLPFFFSRLHLSVNNSTSYLVLQIQPLSCWPHLCSLLCLHTACSLWIPSYLFPHFKPSIHLIRLHLSKAWPLDQKPHKGRGCYLCVCGNIPNTEDCAWGAQKCFLSGL